MDFESYGTMHNNDVTILVKFYLLCCHNIFSEKCKKNNK